MYSTANLCAPPPHAGALFFVYATQFLRLCSEVIGLSLPPSNRTEHLLIYRIQSHTNPKRRKVSLKQAGQKSSKEELPKQRKGPKRAVECRLKIPTHIWEQEARGSSPRTPTTLRRKPPFLAVFLRFLFYFYARDACCSAVVQGAEKRREHD